MIERRGAGSREGEIALFDPAAILSRARQARGEESDDASRIISLPFNASKLMFPAEGNPAVALGSGEVAFIDQRTSAILEPARLPTVLEEASLLQPIQYTASGDLLVGVFPVGIVTAIAPPSLPDPPPLPVVIPPSSPPEPPPLRDAIETAPEEEPASLDPPPTIALPEPEVAPPERRAPPLPPAAAVIPSEDLFLSGRVLGERSLVIAIVLYGPDNIIRERERLAPQQDGVFRFSLPPPGKYRLVPVGMRSRALVSEPNFHTVEVRPEGGRAGLDFRISKAP